MTAVIAATGVDTAADIAAGSRSPAALTPNPGNPAFERVAPQRHQNLPAGQLIGLVAGLGALGEGMNASHGRRRGAVVLADYLARWPGETWQQRWQTSPVEKIGPFRWRHVVCDTLGVEATAGRLWLLTGGLGALIALDALRPSFEFFLSVRLLWSHLPR